jgi:amiloride-sensitive sodium channel
MRFSNPLHLGIQSGLSVQLKINESLLGPSCIKGTKGFRISLHMPVESPHISNQYYDIPFSKQTNVIVKPNMIYASKSIKGYKPNDRLCYFNSERKLKYFKIYSKANCDNECKADYVKRQCKCVKFSMPRDNSTIVCDNMQLKCVHEAEMNHTTRDLELKLVEKQLKRDVKHGKAKKNDERFEKIKIMKKNSCNCLPTCTNIKYDVEISQTDYDDGGDG